MSGCFTYDYIDHKLGFGIIVRFDGAQTHTIYT